MNEPRIEIMTVAGGCFWGVEAAFRQIPGVIKTRAGYTGTTGHAEAVEVEFDPEEVSYKRLLEHFWQMHNPTELNRKGPDVGTQYRSAIFYHSPEQQAVAKTSKDQQTAIGRFQGPIVTKIEPAGPFYAAEDYNQRYLEKRGLATCTPALR